MSDGKEGIYARLDSQSVADAIAALRSNPTLRTQLGAAAKEKVQAFSLDTIKKRMEEIYRSVSE